MAFKSGFVNIIGLPNAGKSTLMNRLIGEHVSIVSPKIQTTRHRIHGIINGDDYQLIFSDTPGIISKTKYELHTAMMKFVNEALEDADVLMYLLDAKNETPENDKIIKGLKEKIKVPFYVLLNKVDLLAGQSALESRMAHYAEIVGQEYVIPISATEGFGIDAILRAAIDNLPESPPYFDSDAYTDKTERFLASEIIREKIFENYKQEIPYSSEVIVTSFKEEESIIRIAAEIFVERQSQKGIIIGKGGEGLKKVGTQARIKMEEVFAKKIFLELFVKVREDWRENKRTLRQFGFDV